MTPGPIGINAATFFGYRLGGVAGACLATAALVLPGALLLLFALRSLARFGGNRLVRGVLDGVRPVTLSLMMQAAWAFAGLSLWRCAAGTLSFNGVACLIAVAALVLVVRRRLGVMPVVFLSAVASVAAKGIAAFAGAGL
jgi:chromate transporter